MIAMGATSISGSRPPLGGWGGGRLRGMERTIHYTVFLGTLNRERGLLDMARELHYTIHMGVTVCYQ
jgi:hypothetical protein